MGQKVNAHLIRLQKVFNWDSRWFNEKEYKETLLEDYKLREFLLNRLSRAGIARVEIERSINSIRIITYVSRPGMVIGRGGTGLEELKKSLTEFFRKSRKGAPIPKIDIRIEPVKEPSLDSYLVAKNISEQLIRRLPYKKILTQNADRVMSAGALGVRILLSGRIGGAEIGRREKIQVGTVPLSTVKSNIDFISMPSLTKKGYIGIKVWINKKEEK